MEALIASLVFYDFDVCGGAILLDGRGLHSSTSQFNLSPFWSMEP